MSMRHTFEELMGAGPSSAQKQQQQNPSIMAGKMKPPVNPAMAKANLSQAADGMGDAVQGAIDARSDDQARRNGDPSMDLQHAQPQPPRGTPQVRLKQQQDDLQLKQGTVPQDLTKNVAQIAQAAVQKYLAGQKAQVPAAPNQAPAQESVKEATVNKANAFTPDLEAGNPEDKPGQDNMTAATKAAIAKHKAQVQGDNDKNAGGFGKDGTDQPRRWKTLTSSDSMKSRYEVAKESEDGKPICPVCEVETAAVGQIQGDLVYRCGTCSTDFACHEEVIPEQEIPVDPVFTDEIRTKHLDEAFSG